VNKPETESEVEAIRRCVKQGSPYGSESWISQSAARLSLEHTLRSRGRPRIPKQ
jgi:putative transposase